MKDDFVPNDFNKLVLTERDIRRRCNELTYELDGVIVDCSEADGPGFDDVCLRTLKRVKAELHMLSKLPMLPSGD